MKVDLHVHTQESDGLLTVEEVVNLAHDNNVQILGITDHESTEGISKAQSLAKKFNININGLNYEKTNRFIPKVTIDTETGKTVVEKVEV